MSKAILTSDEIKARKKAYRASPEGKAVTAAYNKMYAEKHAERLREYRVTQYAETKDEKRESKSKIGKEYRERNKEEINRRRRLALKADDVQRCASNVRASQWYKDNKDEASTKAKSYYVENREYIKARISAYQKANPEATRMLHRVKAHRRRARLEQAGGEFTRQDIERLFELQRGRCTNCHTSLKNGYHIDHRLPVAKGGGNHPHNLELLCPTCNGKKSAKLPHEFAQENGRLI